MKRGNQDLRKKLRDLGVKDAHVVIGEATGECRAYATFVGVEFEIGARKPRGALDKLIKAVEEYKRENP